MKRAPWDELIGEAERRIRRAWLATDRLAPAERLRANQSIARILRSILETADRNATHECDDPACPLARLHPRPLTGVPEGVSTVTDWKART